MKEGGRREGRGRGGMVVVFVVRGWSVVVFVVKGWLVIVVVACLLGLWLSKEFPQRRSLRSLRVL